MDDIFEAVSSGDLTAIQEALDNGADVNALSNDGRTPLMTADSVEIAQLLIERGADVNARDDEGKTPLIWACEKGISELIELLIRLDTDVNAKSKSGRTPLMFASANKSDQSDQIIRTLIASGAIIQEKDNDGKSALEYASQAGNSDTAKLLLSFLLLKACKDNDLLAVQNAINTGADINAQDNEGTTPLMLVSRYGDAQLVDLLIASGADVLATNNKKATSLIFATSNETKDRDKIIQVLIDHGVDLNRPDKDGWTPLMHAARYRDAQLVNLLIDHDADVNYQKADGLTSLTLATRNESQERDAIIKTLITHGAKLNIKNQSGWSLLMSASGYRDPQLVKLLIEACASDINEKNNDGWTPLMIASRHRDAQLVKLLIDAGADVNVSDNDGWTPLMIVSRYRDAQLASLLIDAGANVNAKNAQEESPILLATHREDDERDNIIKLLAEHGADVNTKDKASWTPLMHAARYHDAQFVKLLIDVGADVHVTNNDGATAIFMAICNFTEKRYDIIQVLVDHGADVNVTVDNDMTPLRFVTLLCPDKRLIELLVSLGAK